MDRFDEINRKIENMNWWADLPIERREAICAAEKDGRCVILPCKVGDTVNKLFSHNEIIALWEEHKNEEASPKYLIWKGMAWDIPVEQKERIVLRIFGAVPESIVDADTVNILVTPIITPCGAAEEALRKEKQ